MSAELLINVTPSETRVVMIEDGVLQEVHVERDAKKGIVSNIYRGNVIRVLPGMQAAFVDIGLEKAAFLHASDIAQNTQCVADDEKQQFEKSISQLVRAGQEIIVQAIKEPLGTKGARLTTDITLPSRYLVFMPDSNHVGVSQRIASEEEKERLRSLVAPYCDEKGGFIIRTAAEGIGKQEIEQDADFLKRLWQKIDERRQRKKGRLLYGELGVAPRLLRDFVGTEIHNVLVDSKQAYDELKHFVEEFIPALTDKLTLYTKDKPIFDMYEAEKEIQRSLDRNVPLKSGGYLVIDQTEAMTTIDINTGAFVGRKNLEETIFNTNLEATSVIARQLRLRNLGGIIIIDFIDMQTKEYKERVLASLEKALQSDRVKTIVHDFTQLGLVEMTRKRTRESLEQVLCSTCPTCQARGMIKTVETICYEILREITRVNRAYESDGYIVYASPAVIETLKGDESHALAELELFIGKEVILKSELFYSQEEFDVVMM